MYTIVSAKFWALRDGFFFFFFWESRDGLILGVQLNIQNLEVKLNASLVSFMHINAIINFRSSSVFCTIFEVFRSLQYFHILKRQTFFFFFWIGKEANLSVNVWWKKRAWPVMIFRFFCIYLYDIFNGYSFFNMDIYNGCSKWFSISLCPL